MQLAPTPRDTILRDGIAQLYHFRGAAPATEQRTPLLFVPSMINRWYVLDLRTGASVVEATVNAGLDAWCLDWGIPEDEDRFLSWDDVLSRLRRVVRRVKRETGAEKVGILGYCMGGTVSGIYTALYPEDVATLINLAGPYDFSKGGLLRRLVDARWFDSVGITAAGNVGAQQMQQGFVTLRPTANVAKWAGLADRLHDGKAREAFEALETWSSDNIPFPAAAYATYIRELYQQNLLVKGGHYAHGRRVDLSNIRCPVLTIVAERDTICPPEAATALNAACGSDDVIKVPGGHVGAVVGSRAEHVLYPAICEWLRSNQ